MSLAALSLILVSAFMHAWWNLLVKRSEHKTVFIWWMFVSSGLLFTILWPLLPGSLVWPTPQVWGLALAGSACFMFYHICNGMAYRYGADLSMAYPLAQTSMIYVPIWGVLFLGESLSWLGGIGIMAIICGAYVIQMESLRAEALLQPLRNLSHPAVQAALAAGFIYSVGSIADKVGVGLYNPTAFTYLLVLIMLVLMSLNLCRRAYRGMIREEWRQNRGLILLSGPVMLLSFLTFRWGLAMAPVSYAVPVRRVNLLCGVLIGVLFLKESCGRIRLAAAGLILLGVVLIRFG